MDDQLQKITNDKILAELAALHRIQEEAKEDFHKSQEAIQKKIERIDHAIYGNGQEGLLVKVKALETTDRIQNRSIANWLIGVGLASSILLGLAGLFIK